VPPAPEAAGYIASWRPSSVSPQAASFARAVVAAAGPPGRERAKNLLRAAGKLAGYGIGLGLEPVPQVLLHPSVIERFAAHAPGLTGVTRRTLRANLRFLARAVVPHLCPADAPLARERARAPYTRAEIGGYLALADAQPALARRMRAAGLVCLGAGAGLIRSGLRQVRGSDVCCRAGGVIVTVRGARPRAVPVLARYHQPLTALPEADQARLGVTEQWKAGPHQLTYRQAGRTFNLVAEALASEHPDGAPSAELARVCDDLLEASIPARYKDTSAALAVDWTDAESWSRPPRHGTSECADPEAHWGHRNSNLPGPEARCSSATTCRLPPWCGRRTGRPSRNWPGG